jgi:hypothetical protein
VHDHRRRLVDPDTHERRAIEDCRQQTIGALPLDEMLIDDHLRPEA